MNPSEIDDALRNERRIEPSGEFPSRVMRAVRRGSWKLLADGQALFLFDLSKDIGERTDLSSVRQDLVKELRQKIVDWEKDVDSEFKLRTKPTQ